MNDAVRVDLFAGKDKYFPLIEMDSDTCDKYTVLQKKCFPSSKYKYFGKS